MGVIRISCLIPGLVVLLALCSCRGTPSQTTQRRPIQQMPGVVYADTIPVADFRAVCDALARDLVVQPFIARSDRPPVVTIRKLQNKTDVDLDEEIFQETIRVKLVEHAQGAVLFRDDASYRDIVEERLRSSGNEIEISITDSRVDTQSADRFRDLEYEAGSLSGSRLDNQRSAMREDETEVEMEQSGSVSARVAEVDYFLRGLVYQVREPDARNPKQGMNYFQYQFRVVDARNGIIVWEKMLDGKLEGEYMPLKKKSRSGTGALGAPPNYFPQNPQPQTQTPGTPPAPTP